MSNPTGIRHMSTKGFKRSMSAFEHQWNMHVLEIAELEGSFPEAIYQRVYRFGSPFQRKLKPSMIERHYAKTASELAEELGMHPLTICGKHRNNGTAYFKLPRTEASKGWSTTDHSWKDNPKYGAKPWLMEQHPDYDAWRAGELFADDFIPKPADY